MHPKGMEGPSLLILREELALFQGQHVLHVTGNTHQPKERLKGTTLQTIDTWGKHLFLIFAPPKPAPPIIAKIHFLMFGSYRIDEPRIGRSPRLQLTFPKGKLYLYSCSLRLDADIFWSTIDRRTDIMSPQLQILQSVSGIPASYLFGIWCSNVFLFGIALQQLDDDVARVCSAGDCAPPQPQRMGQLYES